MLIYPLFFYLDIRYTYILFSYISTEIHIKFFILDYNATKGS